MGSTRRSLLLLCLRAGQELESPARWSPGRRDDRADRSRFVSFGPWESLEAIESWRALEGFQRRVAKIRELLVGFEPLTLDLLVSEG